MFDPDVVSFAHGEGVRRPYPEAISAMMRALADPESMPLENYMFLQRFTELEEAVAAGIEDILITLGTQYQIVRPINQGTDDLFLYLVLDRSRANLAMARFRLTKLAEQIEV